MSQPLSRPRKTWKRRSSARPDELRAAALRLFSERGYGGATMEDIAEAATVTVGTVYRYFRDKEALLASLVECAAAEPLLGPRPSADSAADPLSQFRAALTAIWSASRRSPHGDMLRLMVAESGNAPELVRQYRTAVLDPAVHLLAGILDGGRAGDGPVLRARATLANLLGASLLAGSGAIGESLIPQLAPLEISIEMIARAAFNGAPPPVAPPKDSPPVPRITRYSGPDAW
jgi:AcrR family transcriptional regulator